MEVVFGLVAHTQGTDLGVVLYCFVSDHNKETKSKREEGRRGEGEGEGEGEGRKIKEE